MLERTHAYLYAATREMAAAIDAASKAIEPLQGKLREYSAMGEEYAYFLEGQLRMLEMLKEQLLVEKEWSARLLKDGAYLSDAPMHKRESQEQMHKWVESATELAKRAELFISRAVRTVQTCMRLETEPSEELVQMDEAIDRYGSAAKRLERLCRQAARQLEDLLASACACASPSAMRECDARLPYKEGETPDADVSLYDLTPSRRPVPPPPPMPSASVQPPVQPSAKADISVPDGKQAGPAVAPPVQKSPEPAPTPAPQKKKGGLFGWLKGRKKDAAVPPPQVDSVQFSAVAPNQVVPGKYLPIHIVMYEDAMRKTVEDIIRSHGENAKEARSGYHDVARDATVKVVLSSPDVTVEDGVEERIWKGKYLNFEFAVKIPGDFDGEQILFSAAVYINDVIATKLKLILDCAGQPKRNMTVTRSDIVSAFVSYASQDRKRVASIIQGMKKARPDMDIFFDIESLRSGQKWEEALKTEIENRDILFLCWSRFARASQWVDMEWRYALENKGEDCIEPIPIDSPDICPPPAELQNKHFNDKMLYIIQAPTVSEAGQPCLVHRKSNARIVLDQPVVHIGTDPSRVDLCIWDNHRISRTHADILREDGKFYIIDTGSTNHTYVNGEQIPSNKRVQIGIGAKIRLADEEFELVIL